MHRDSATDAVEKFNTNAKKKIIFSRTTNKLLYLKMVRGAEDSVYKRLHTQYDALLGEEESKTNSYGITYHKTFPLPDFEKMINGEVLIKQLPNGYMWAQFEANGKKQVAQVHKTIRKQKDTPKQSMAVSLCKDANGQVFWLLHHKNKPTRF